MRKRIAIEVGGSKIQAALGDSAGNVLAVRRVAADPQRGQAGILHQIREVAGPLLGGEVEKAVFGFGGPVDARTGKVVKSHQVEGWEGFALADWGRKMFGCPCELENDTNCAGLAEARLGAGQGGRCVFYSNVGSGIGGAIVIDGKLHNGRYGAGEVGHTYVWNPAAGRYDTTENLCSGWALDRRARRLAANGQTPRLLALAGGRAEAVDARLVGKVLAQEDKMAGLDEPSIRAAGIDEGAMDEAGELLDDLTGHYAVALANVIALLNPDRLIVGGGVSLIGQPFFGRLSRRLREICFEPYRDNWQLSPAGLGEDVVLVGALLL